METMRGEAAVSAEDTVRETELARLVFEREAAKQQSARWPAGYEDRAGFPYQLCTRTVMDTTDPTIRFDADGVCNWVEDFAAEVRKSLLPPSERAAELQRVVDKIRADGRGKEHDCVVGLSGGVDSSYLAVLCVELGLRPLLVHFDNGWNTELAVQNIEHLVRKLGLSLSTFVMDWPEFRDLQRSYFKASVLDLEVPTDHMIFGAVYKTASKHGIRHVISGNNLETEWLLPRAWYYPKFDLVNLKNIQKRYGTVKLKKLPALGLGDMLWYQQARGIRGVMLLDLLAYDKPAAKKRLQAEFEWRDYGGKHHESVFTRFYQGYILPRKFNIDKRKAHLSNLILAGQMTRLAALEELLQPTYDERVCKEDFTFVAKKLGFSEAELERLLELPNRSHAEFGSDRVYRDRYQRAVKRLQPLKPLAKPLLNLLRRVGP